MIDIFNNRTELETIKRIISESDIETCEKTIPNLMLWTSNFYIENNQLIVSTDEPKGTVYRLPMGENIETGINVILKKENNNYPIFYAPEGKQLNEFMMRFSDLYIFVEDENSFDYVYLRDNLAYLPGKKYHSKRNHISSFSKKYDWHYEALTDDNINKFRECAKRWYWAREDINATLKVEQKGLMLLFDHYKDLGIIGGGIVVDNNIVAFSLGSQINPDMFDIFIEKALPNYVDAYAVINCEFAKRLNYKYINREDDMGIDGLKKAKLSYHPCMMLKKYYCYPKTK